jgi:carbonic anhydrase/acetyltransferase-like protein (isoleucine patch superfamily)
MLIRSINGKTPRFGERVFVATTAVVVGDVVLGDDVSVWYNVVLRGDIEQIRIGARSNLQDGVIVHVEHDLYPTLVGEDVTVGHGAILHGCRIGRACMIGMGALVLNDAEIGEESIVAAGTVVREGFKIPPRSLVTGVPARVKRQLEDEEVARAAQGAISYLGYKSRFLVDGEDCQVDEIPRESQS